jgi:hypothetical protein
MNWWGQGPARKGTDMDSLIDQLSQVLMDAYAALPVQDQEGPLGEKISAVLHEVQLILFREQQEKDTAIITRLTRLR